MNLSILASCTSHRVLAHGYALNHTALSVHRLLKTSGGAPPCGGPSDSSERWSLLEFSEKAAAAGIVLNQEGGVIKVCTVVNLYGSQRYSDLLGLDLVIDLLSRHEM